MSARFLYQVVMPEPDHDRRVDLCRNYLHTVQVNSLYRYVKFGLHPGNYLAAVLANDLREAVKRATAQELHDLPVLLYYISCTVPSGMEGSPEVVKEQLGRYPELRLSDGG